METDEFRVLAEAVASNAISGLSAGEGIDEVREFLIGIWQSAGAPRGLFSAARDSLPRLPQPVSESLEKSERMSPIREMLGMESPADQLVVSLRALEILQDLANEFDQ